MKQSSSALEPMWPAMRVVLVLISAGQWGGTVRGDEPRGAVIYRELCSSCHGDRGQGGDGYSQALTGDLSPNQLARYIDQTMPEDAPEKCVGEEAQAVATYISDAFYSPLAQARNASPRIELSRLTVRQFRHTVADLIGTFRSSPPDDPQRGLHGEYYASRDLDKAEDRVLHRVDPEVRFSFGMEAPGAERFDARAFSIRWEGALLAPETGDYELILETENAARLWLNDPREPLIDAWVKSGDEREFRASLFLLGGRAYPLKLEFSKSKQGVDDSDKQKDSPIGTASIGLLWKRPHGEPEVVRERYLAPRDVPPVFVNDTPFPPDDRSQGFERGTSVSEAWNEALTEAAIRTSAYVVKHLPALSGIPEDAPGRDARLRNFATELAARAMRRPLDEELRLLLVDQQFESAPDVETAVKRIVLLCVQSPRLLFQSAGGPDGGLEHDQDRDDRDGDDYDVASRLALFLWDSLPDRELIEAAAAGRLRTRQELQAQAERMMADQRARAKLRDFFMQWLRVDMAGELTKDAERFPQFDKGLVSDLRTSLELLTDEVVSSESSDFRELLLTERLPMNGRVARFLGVELAEDAPFQSIAFEPGRRAGVLTHPYLLANFAYRDTSSPIHRGVFLARGVLGRGLRPPVEAFTPLAPDLHPGLTTRERVALQTNEPSCLKCHGMINALGFALEHFDAVGRYRDEENGKPIDATGNYESREGRIGEFTGARQMAEFLATSDETASAFVRQLFHYLVKQPAAAYGADTQQILETAFREHDFHIRQLAIEIAVLASQDVEKRPDAGPSRPANGQP